MNCLQLFPPRQVLSDPAGAPGASPGASPTGQLQATLQEIYSSIEHHWEGGANFIGPTHLFFKLLDDTRDTLPVSGCQRGWGCTPYHRLPLSACSYTWSCVWCTTGQWSLTVRRMIGSLSSLTSWTSSTGTHRVPVLGCRVSTACPSLPSSCDTRTAVRCKALAYLGTVLGDHWLTQEEPLVQRLLLPFLKPLPLDTDSDLRCQAVQLLVHLLPLASTQHALSMLALLSQVHSCCIG